MAEPQTKAQGGPPNFPLLGDLGHHGIDRYGQLNPQLFKNELHGCKRMITTDFAAATAQGQSQAGARWQPERHEADDWLDKLPGKHERYSIQRRPLVSEKRFFCE